MGPTAADVVNALKAFLNPASPPPTIAQLKALVKSVEWDVPASKNVIFYSGKFVADGSVDIQGFRAVAAIKGARPDSFFQVDSCLDSGGRWDQQQHRCGGVR